MEKKGKVEPDGRNMIGYECEKFKGEQLTSQKGMVKLGVGKDR